MAATSALKQWLSPSKVAWALLVFFCWVLWSDVQVMKANQQEQQIALATLGEWSKSTERDRFRRDEALKMEARLLKEVADPPQWLKDDLKAVEADLRDIDKKLARIEQLLKARK